MAKVQFSGVVNKAFAILAIALAFGGFSLSVKRTLIERETSRLTVYSSLQQTDAIMQAWNDSRCMSTANELQLDDCTDIFDARMRAFYDIEGRMGLFDKH
jgi:hypothetical protein